MQLWVSAPHWDVEQATFSVSVKATPLVPLSWSLRTLLQRRQPSERHTSFMNSLIKPLRSITNFNVYVRRGRPEQLPHILQTWYGVLCTWQSEVCTSRFQQGKYDSDPNIVEQQTTCLLVLISDVINQVNMYEVYAETCTLII